jgi:hypothetical protein
LYLLVIKLACPTLSWASLYANSVKMTAQKGFLIIGIILTLVQCSGKNEARHDYPTKVELIPSSQITFTLDSLTSHQSNAKFYHDEKSGRDYLVCFNKNNRRLVFYDFATRQRVFSTKFASEGPNGVGEMCFFHVHNLDSIFIQSPPIRFVLADTSGRVTKVYALNESPGYLSSYCLISNQNYNPIRDGKFYFPSWPDGFGENLKVRNNSVLGQIDLASGRANTLPVLYPTFFKQGEWHMIHYEIGILLHPQGGFLLNFPGADSVYHWQNGKSTPHYAASADAVEPAQAGSHSIADDQKKYDRLILEQPVYPTLVYDNYRKVYYRLAWLAHDDTSILDDIVRIYVEKPLKIIILDENLVKIGETNLPANRYFSFQCFLGPEGLYLSDAHPDNPEIQEDRLSFTLLKLQRHVE